MHKRLIPIVNEIFKRACEIEKIRKEDPSENLEDYMFRIEEEAVAAVWMAVRDNPKQFETGETELLKPPQGRLMQHFLVEPVLREADYFSSCLELLDSVTPEILQTSDLHANFRKVSSTMRARANRIPHVQHRIAPFVRYNKAQMKAESWENDCIKCRKLDYCQDFGDGLICLYCYSGIKPEN